MPDAEASRPLIVGDGMDETVALGGQSIRHLLPRRAPGGTHVAFSGRGNRDLPAGDDDPAPFQTRG